MTESQRHGIAAGFLHVLEAHHDIYERWAKMPKEAVGIGKLIQHEMGLASPPDKADLHAMQMYIDARLKDEVGKIRHVHANVPKVVGIGVGAESEEG
jgi:hypothetical protein